LSNYEASKTFRRLNLAEEKKNSQFCSFSTPFPKRQQQKTDKMYIALAGYDKLFNVKYLPLFHHFKAIYQFPKHIFFLVKIVSNASLI
jgi:hypothetical protein